MENNKGQRPDWSLGDLRHVRARKRLWRAKRRLGSYRALGRELGVNVGYLQPFVVSGIEPANPDVRKKLGLPAHRRDPARPRMSRKYRRSAWFWEHQLRHPEQKKS